MTSIEQAIRIYALCVDCANHRRTLTYGEVLNSLGYANNVRGHAIRYGLELVLIACIDMGLPRLTAIVVDNATGRPAEGGYPQDRWQADVQAVFAFREWPPVDEIDWAYVWRNRKMLSNRHTTPGYWGRSTQ